MEAVIDFKNLVKDKDNIKKIFMYRICGTGMGAAACLLKEKGYQVEGGDIKFAPPMGQYLKETGIPLHDLKEMSREYLKNFDLIVVGNVVSGKSEEAREIERQGVPLASFPSVLGAFILQDFNVVGVSGTHGKTTTTYLLTQVFEKFGFKPGYFIGGVVEGRNSARLGDGSYFFIESDEYDSAYFEKISKFRRYAIDHLILTSLEFDHADIFNDIEEIKNQFRALIPEVTSSFIFSEDYVASRELCREFKDKRKEKKWSFYGESSENGPRILKMDARGTKFELDLGGEFYKFDTNLVGKHNILNLSSAIIFAHSEGIEVERIADAVRDLKLVKRRQEERGYYKGALMIDDFAHHPRAVELTFESVKIKYPGKRIITILEPNSATARSDIFQEKFTEVLSEMEKIIIIRPKSPTTVVDANDLDCNKMAHILRNKGKDAKVAENLEQLREMMDQLANEDSIFLVLSNGTCLGLWV